MKVYISGKISGLPMEEVREKFAHAEELLLKTGFEVVNPLKNGLAPEDAWIRHLAKDLELLHSCDAIYMLDDWHESKGAQHEHDFALREGKCILDESYTKASIVLRIQSAIYEATGMKISEYTTKSRTRDKTYARMIFAYHCRRNGMSLNQIARLLKRDHSSVVYLSKKYEDDFRYNRCFREFAERVQSMLL